MQRRRLPIFLVVLCLGGPFGSLTAQSQRAALLKADQQAAQLAMDSGFAIALERTLHQDAALLWPEAPVLAGRAAINDFLRRELPKEPLQLSWQPLEMEMSQDSTLAALWGVTLLHNGTPARGPRVGRFISVWKRDARKWTALALVLIGIAPPPAPAPGSSASAPPARDRFSAEAEPFVSADRAFSRLAQDSGAAKAFRSWADDGALIFGGGGLITRGPGAIGQAVAGPERWTWQPVLAGGASSGDLGWTVGEAVITGKVGKPSYSKYLTVWSRRVNRVRFLLDGGNSRPPSQD